MEKLHKGYLSSVGPYADCFGNNITSALETQVGMIMVCWKYTTVVKNLSFFLKVKKNRDMK